MATKLETSYPVNSNDVYLTVIIGEAQLGSSSVTLDSEILCTGEIKDLKIGNGNDIKGKMLRVKSIVSDINDNTNRTSIIYRFKGGKADTEYLLEETVSQDGDSIIYRAYIKFI